LSNNAVENKAKVKRCFDQHSFVINDKQHTISLFGMQGMRLPCFGGDGVLAYRIKLSKSFIELLFTWSYTAPAFQRS
jgi:hypothetical protein